MDKIEIINELNMTYYEMVDYLIQKYGGARYDYFQRQNVSQKIQKLPVLMRDFSVTILMKIRVEIYLKKAMLCVSLMNGKKRKDLFIAMF